MKILIADDEPLARQRLKRLLNESELTPTEYLEASNGFEALTICSEHSPDIVLLDIRMPVMDGLQAAVAITKAKPHCAIIFVTAYDQHALAAFESNAVDYLLKPINKNRLQQAITKAQHYLGQPSFTEADLAPLLSARSHLCSTSSSSTSLIKVSDIICFKAEQKYICAYTASSSFLLEESLQALEDEFKQQFTRVHRNALVNIKHIEQLRKNAQGQHQLLLRQLDQPITVSRRHLATFRKLLQQIH